MLTDTGAFCNCISYEFYEKWLYRITGLSPNRTGQQFISADNSALNARGWIELPVKIGGRETTTHFQVIDRLSRPVILGVPYLQSTGAVLDFDRKRISLYGNAVSLPLLTSTDDATAIRTIKRVKIPANHEVIIPVPLPKLPGAVAITETLQQTLGKGMKVATALIDCNKRISVCRIANPTNRPVLWKAGHAFAYVTPLPHNGAGVNLVDMSEYFNARPTVNKGVCTISEQRNNRIDVTDSAGRAPNPSDHAGKTAQRILDDETSGQRNHKTPPHAERLRVLSQRGIKIGTNVLNAEQAERLKRVMRGIWIHGTRHRAFQGPNDR